MNPSDQGPSPLDLPRDALASLVVFLVALPLCMGIAIASGAPVSAGLITGIVGGIVVGGLSGCPLQISGPAAGLTVIVYECIHTYGLERLGLIVVLAGGLQVLAGLLRLGPWFRAVSPAVIQGMLAGIGILIMASQFHVMLDDAPQGGGLRNLLTIPAAIGKAAHQASLPAPEARRAQRELLQALGDIHREQVQLQESILERLPDVQRHGPTSPGEVVDVTEFALPLQMQSQRLDQALDRAESFYAETPRKLRLYRERHESVSAAMQAAVQTLEDPDTTEIVATQAAAVAAIERLQGVLKHHELAAGVGVLAIVVLILWKRLVPRRLRAVPAPLIAVLLTTVVATIGSLPILYVEVPDNIAREIHIPTWTVLADAPWTALFGAALLLAAVASAETLLSATAVDQLHSGPRTNYDRELFAQGVGNLVCGMLGVLPLTGVIVRSGANVQAGARSRWSAILHGVWLLVFVAGFAAWLRLVPQSCLAGILVYTGYKLVNWKSVLLLRNYGWGEVAIYAVTVSVIVVADLLTGVVVGVGLAIAKLLYNFSQLETALEVSPDQREATLHLRGAATFIRLPQLASVLEQVPAGCKFQIGLEQLDYVDHACLELLMSWSQLHAAAGGHVSIDWDRLHLTARLGGPRRPRARIPAVRREAASHEQTDAPSVPTPSPP